MATVGWLTCERFPDGFEREQATLALLRAAGHRVTPWPWRAPAPEKFDLVVVRSPWDYHLHVAEWGAWLDGLRMPCLNPVDILRWNSDKSYLIELEARGIRIVPTVLARAGRSLAEAMGEWDDVVVKPVISASAHRTWRTGRGAEERFQAELAAGDLLVQPFLPEVTQAGEWSLIFIDRLFSHAVLKRPAVGDFRSQEEYGSRIERVEPAAFLLQAAEAVLEHVPGPLLYARVDGLVRGEEFSLMELELVDPTLFLEHDPEASGRFAEAILRHL